MQIKLAMAARFGRNEWGGASVFALFMTLMLLIVAGFAIDSQRLVAEQTKLQIAADSAAHAAVYFRQTMDEDEAIAAAVDLGRGTIPLSSNPDALRPEDVQFGIWDGSTFTPKAGSTQAARVVTGNSQRRGRGLRTYLLRLSGVSILDVETQAIYASGGTGGCIYALDDKGEGVRLTGGTSIDAEECAIVSNANVSAPCGTSITTAGVLHDGSVSECEWGDPNISDGKGNHAPMSEQHTADPFSANAQIKALHARFRDIRGSLAPAQVSVTGGPDILFGWAEKLDDSLTSQLAAMGCTVDHEPWKADWSVSCTAGAEINLGTLSVYDGITVDFNSGSDVGTTYNFSGGIKAGNKPLRFGSGTFNIAKGVSGPDIRFGAGSFHIGKGDCGYSLCDTGTFVFEGLGTYIFDAGIKVGQGATLKLGDGAYANYYYMGAGQNGNAINVEQSGRLEFGDAIGQIDGFRVDGKFANGGGACTVFPKTENHDFSDDVYMRGAAIFGAGAYHVDGSFHLTAGGAECEEDAPAIWGDDVTMVISGRTVPASSSAFGCDSSAYCLDGGQAIRLVAPTSGPNTGMGVIGPIGPGQGGGYISAGGSSRLSGVMYFPNDPIKLDGGASLGGSSETDCLQIVGSEVTMDGGPSVASECIDTSGGGRISMVR